jgi:hypothetical protein
MTKIARTPTYSREATRETSFHGLAAPHFSGAFELLGHASRSMLKMPALKEMNRHMWGVGEAHTPHMSASFLAAALFSSLPGPRAAPGRRRRQEGGGSWLVVPLSRNIINSSGPPGPLNLWRALGPSRA